MSNFKKGDRVVVVLDKGKNLPLGEEYVVSEAYVQHYEDFVKLGGRSEGFYSKRFKLVQAKKAHPLTLIFK
jgi:hypothetical protein